MVSRIIAESKLGATRIGAMTLGAHRRQGGDGPDKQGPTTPEVSGPTLDCGTEPGRRALVAKA